MSKPLVSVLMITYNQEKFIGQAVQSALDQKTDFPYELVIGDDNSTDKTRAILKKYQRENQDKIKLILQKTNLKPTKNLMSVYAQCKGKYIALLEGDDYWISPTKLQSQVDFLERHPTFAICFHAAQMVNRYQQPVMVLPTPSLRRTCSLEDLIWNESFMATCSTMFRNRLFGKFPNWFYSLTFIADLPLNVLNAEYGKIGYINKIMSVYRSNSSDKAFSAQSRLTINREGLVMFAGLNQELKHTYADIIRDKMARNYFEISQDLLHMGDYPASQHAYDEYLKHTQTTKYVSKFMSKWLYYQLQLYSILFRVLKH